MKVPTDLIKPKKKYNPAADPALGTIIKKGKKVPPKPSMIAAAQRRMSKGR